MRRISLAFSLATVLLPSTAALAAHHRMGINEVLLSSGGDDSVQYVELHDIAVSGEPFPDDYVLGVYDVDGQSLGEVPLALPGDTYTTDWYVATTAADAEFGPNGQDELTIALPAAGQVCFEHTDGTKFSCLAWGCVNNVLTGSTAGLSGRGASPPDGMSVGRQSDGTYTIGVPTPSAANEAGDEMPACPTDPDAGPSVDAGNAGDVDAGPDGPDGGGGGGGGDGGDDDDSGCGCGVNGGGGAASTLALGAAVLLFAFRRRRRA